MRENAKKIVALVLTFTMVLASVQTNRYEAKAEETEVINISTAEELGSIGVDSNYPMDGSYKLTADIENVQTTIGNSSTPFTGQFDGDGHSITFDITDAPNYTGLFGYARGAVIQNVIAKGTMNVQYGWTAGIVAKAESSTITNCGSEVNIISAGSNMTCFAGIAGYAKNTTITDCYNSGNISGKIKNAAGIAGQTNTSVNIENCYNVGTITTTATSAQRVGGVVGYGQVSSGQTGKIYNCYNSGVITGSGQVGSFIGYIYTGFEAKNCYYLEGTHENAFGFQYEADTSDINAVTEEELKGLQDALGTSFVICEDINNGYPVLTWQMKETDTSIEDTATLEAVLENLPSTIRPDFSSDKNIITYVENKIAALDEFKDKQIDVALKSVEPRKEGEPAGIDMDGTLHYVYMDLFQTDAITINSNKITWIDTTFTLMLNESSVDYTTGVALRWDLDQVKEDIQKVADHYVTDDILQENPSLDEVVTNLQLPYYPIIDTEDGTDIVKWVKVTYTSSNPEILSISENPNWSTDYSNQYYTAIVNRPEEDTQVTITATFDFDRYDETYNEGKIQEPVTKEMNVTVLADTERVEQKALQQSVNHYEEYLSDFNAKEPLDMNAVKNDIQLAIPRNLGIDGKYYDITVESSDPSVIEVYGYRTYTYRPLPGEEPNNSGILTTIVNPDEIVPDNKRYWISSDKDIIEDQSLTVTQPEYNKTVTVGAIITHEVFEKYADRYAEDAVYGEKFAKLKNQTVTCELTVIGTKGAKPTEEVSTNHETPTETTTSTISTEVTTKTATATKANENESKVKKTLKIAKLKCKKTKKKVKLTWKRNKQASGYVVRYRKGSKKKYMKKIIKSNKKHSIKIKRYKNLVVTIRAYKVVNGKKIYGAWKKRKIK